MIYPSPRAFGGDGCFGQDALEGFTRYRGIGVRRWLRTVTGSLPAALQAQAVQWFDLPCGVRE